MERRYLNQTTPFAFEWGDWDISYYVSDKTYLSIIKYKNKRLHKENASLDWAHKRVSPLGIDEVAVLLTSSWTTRMVLYPVTIR